MTLRWTIAGVLALAACKKVEPPKPPAATADASAPPAVMPDAAPPEATPPDTDASVADAATPAPAADDTAKVIRACSPPKGGRVRTFTDNHGGKKVKVKQGEEFQVELDSPVSTPRKYGWQDPKLDGTSVEYQSRSIRPRPKNINGGVYHHLFHFCGNAAGVTKVTIAVKGDTDGWPEDFRLTVTVK